MSSWPCSANSPRWWSRPPWTRPTSTSRAGEGHDLSVEGVTAISRALKERIAEATGGVTGSVGHRVVQDARQDRLRPARSSNGLVVVPPGSELDVLHPLPVTRLGGVGPATAERLHQVGVKTVADLAGKSLTDLVALAGRAHGAGLYALARAEDDRPVVPDREVKSVSHEETFERDLTDLEVLGPRSTPWRPAWAAGCGPRPLGADGDAQAPPVRLHHDHPVADAPQPTDDPRQIATTARRLLADAGTAGGLRLLGVGVSGLSLYAGRPFADDDELLPESDPPKCAGGRPRLAGVPVERRWWPGQDVARGVRCRLGVGPGAGAGHRPLRGPADRRPGRCAHWRPTTRLLQPADPPDWRIPRDRTEHVDPADRGEPRALAAYVQRFRPRRQGRTWWGRRGVDAMLPRGSRVLDAGSGSAARRPTWPAWDTRSSAWTSTPSHRDGPGRHPEPIDGGRPGRAGPALGGLTSRSTRSCALATS